MKADTGPASAPTTFTSRLPTWNLAHHIKMDGVTNDGNFTGVGTMSASLAAYQLAADPAPACVSLNLNSLNGFSVHFDTLPHTARALAAALIEAADLCEAFEAEQSIREDRETDRLNAGPIAGKVPA